MLIFTLISAPKCISSNGCVLLSSSSALQPWVGLGLLGCVYYSFKNLSVHTNRWQHQLHFEYLLTSLNRLKQN